MTDDAAIIGEQTPDRAPGAGGSFTCSGCGNLPILVPDARDLPDVMRRHYATKHPEQLCATSNGRPVHGCPHPELCDMCAPLGWLPGRRR